MTDGYDKIRVKGSVHEFKRGPAPTGADIPAPVPLELVACLRRLVHTFDDPADDADAFLDALREARRVLAMYDALEAMKDTP